MHALPDATDVDLRPANDLLVRIKAKLDKPTGVLTWRFESIDPLTGQPTDDPLAGFLPPNVNQPEGDGAVFFTIRPNAGLPHGTEIRNQASIVFDFNDPIATPEWLNTLDGSIPASQVLALAAVQHSTNFEVTWSGTDTGSGIEAFTVFVAVAGGPPSVWLSNTTATSGVYPGQPNQTYSFFSVAQDHAGNLEEGPATSDTTTLTPLPLHIRRDADDIILEWSVPGRLQSSDTLTDGFVDVPAASSPYRFRLDAGPLMLWRLVD